MTTNAEQIAKSSCILEIHIRQPGFKKKMNPYRFLEISGNNGNIQPDYLSASKQLLPHGSLYYLESERTSVLAAIKRLSMPIKELRLGNGQYLIPLTSVDPINQLITDYQIKRNERLDQFEAAYPELKEKAKTHLGSHYREEDYPPFSQLRAKYSIDYKFISNSVPEELKKLSDQLYINERKRHNKILEEEANSLKQVMRETFLTLIRELREKLGRDSATGKFNSIPSGRIKALLDFVETFSNKNLIGDKDLEKIVTEAREMLSSTGNFSSDFREEIEKEFQAIEQETTDLIKSQVRSIDLSHYEES